MSKNQIDWLQLIIPLGLVIVIGIGFAQVMGITAADLVALAQGAWELWEP